METKATYPLSHTAKIIEMIVSSSPRHIRCKHIALVLRVAQEPGLTISELNATLAPQSLATTAKLIRELTHQSWRKDRKDQSGVRRLPGFGYLRLQHDLRDYWVKRVYLSEKGRKFIEALCQATRN